MQSTQCPVSFFDRDKWKEQEKRLENREQPQSSADEAKFYEQVCFRVCLIGNSKPTKFDQILKTVDFAEMETQLPIKHTIIQSSKFHIFPGKNEVSS